MMRADAPGKIILFGEHAVVHGQPAIAVPVSALRVRVTVKPGSKGVTIHAPALNATLHLSDPTGDARLRDALLYPVQLALDALSIEPPDLILSVESDIPIGSGLGSGAAVATAIIRAVTGIVSRPLDNATLNALVYEVEKRHHGTPSGIDNTVIVYEQPIYFERGAPMQTIAIAQPFALVVGDTGHSSSTKAAVASARTLFEAEPDRVGAIFARIGDIAKTALRAIESGNPRALGPLMNENHALLRDLTVSSDALDRLCAAARDAGASGAKLSGGGRGGTMIALAATLEQVRDITQALYDAGAARVFDTMVSG